MTSEQQNEAVERAIKRLCDRNRFPFHGEILTIVHILPPSSSRPLRAAWWRGKEISLIAVEENGNFFLRGCDGSVRYWMHAEQRDEVVAASVKGFVSSLLSIDDIPTINKRKKVAQASGPTSPAHQNYVRDLGTLVSEYALESKTNAINSPSDFADGYLSGFHRVVSLMQQQAEAFHIPLADIGLDDIDADVDLV